MIRKLKGAVLLLVVGSLLLSLSACTTTLRGTYTAKDGLIEQSFTFLDGETVEVSAFGINVKGEYEIKDDEITVTYSLLGLSYDWVKSFAKSGASIFIDGTEFVKAN